MIHDFVWFVLFLVAVGALIEAIGPPEPADDDPRKRMPVDKPPPGWLE